MNELKKRLDALYLVVDETVALDINEHVMRVIDALNKELDDSENRYLMAVKGRQDFRQLFKEASGEQDRLKAELKETQLELETYMNPPVAREDIK